MRKRTLRRELVALGEEPFEPSDLQREMVRLHVLNGLSEDRIAAILGLSLTSLRYHFYPELNYSRDELLAMAAGRMVALASQSLDLKVALRANELLLQSRLKAWRVPAADAPDDPDKPLEAMNLAELQRELSRLRALPEGPGADAPEDADEGIIDGVVQDRGL